MQRVVTLYQSTVGKKVMMAVSGIILFGFVLAHMVGNLKIVQGLNSDGVYAMDAYAEFLRDFGYPLLPHEGLLWIARIVLLAAVLVHIVAAVQLTQRSRAARGGAAYKKQAPLSFSYASRTMRWGGVILALFIVYHIMHFTTGQAFGALEGAAFAKGEVYRNYVLAFQNPLIFGVYLLAQAALCFHLYHGVWSVFPTLGATHPRYTPLRRPFAVGYAVVVFVGFMIPPVMVLTGALSL